MTISVVKIAVKIDSAVFKFWVCTSLCSWRDMAKNTEFTANAYAYEVVTAKAG